MSGFPHYRSAALTRTSAIALLAGAVVAIPVPSGAAPGGQSATSAAAANCRAIVQFDRHDFPRRPRIDNKFLPLARGTNIVMSGTVREDDGRLHRHEIVTTVSSATKVLDGVRTLVVFERDFEDGVLQESELAFEAQDRHGTVWNMGEYPEEYDNGILVGAITWISGIAHAKAGAAMLAHSRIGRPAYLQGVAPGVGFRDCARVAQRGQHRCEAGRCYNGVLVVDEFSPQDPASGHQLKYYAPHVGGIEVGAVGGSNPEVLRLAARTMLGRAALAQVDRQVLAQDRRGYRVSPRVYGRTPPVKLSPRRHRSPR